MNSQHCMPASLDIFTSPPIEIATKDCWNDQILPLSGITNDSAIDFVVAPDPSAYIDLARSYFHLQIKVENVDGSALAATASIQLIRLWPHAIFRQIDLFLNQKLVSTASNLYPYRALLESLLSFKKSVKDEQLHFLEYYNGCTVSPTAPELEALFFIHQDVFHQNRCILPGVEVKIKFLRNNDSFVLVSADEGKQYRINIQHITFYPHKVLPIDTLLLEHTRLLGKSNALYPTERAWIKTYSLGKGIQDEIINNIFIGPQPQKIIWGFVKSTAFNGDLKLDPFEFAHFSLEECFAIKNGKSIPSQPLRMDFEKGFARQAYHTFLETILGPCIGDQALGITYDQYINKGTGKKTTLFALNFRPACTGPRDAILPEENGNSNLHLHFKKPLEENVTLIIYGEFQALIEADSNRNVYTNYGN